MQRQVTHHNTSLRHELRRRILLVVLFWFAVSQCRFIQADEFIAEPEFPVEVLATLEIAGSNRTELARALRDAPADQTIGMQFLIANMPEHDAHTLTAEFLLDNVRLAYEARQQSPWGAQIPEDVFLNDVLPYANINERRDNWRSGFRQRFLPMIEGAESPAAAAAMLNQKIFPELKVRYSTQRKRADQGPFQSMESGLASCTGLSILLIDACRSVGVPARFVGTPLWSDGSGNHSWVEVWDKGWHFTGAAEPAGDQLDDAWFTARAAKANIDDPQHAIYAVSFRRTPLTFPLVWDRSIRYVSAVNVTSRYTQVTQPLAENQVHVMFVCSHSGSRVTATVKVTDLQGNLLFEGPTRDARFDRNDHLTGVLPRDSRYTATFETDGTSHDVVFDTNRDDALIECRIP